MAAASSRQGIDARLHGDGLDIGPAKSFAVPGRFGTMELQQIDGQGLQHRRDPFAAGIHKQANHGDKRRQYGADLLRLEDIHAARALLIENQPDGVGPGPCCRLPVLRSCNSAYFDTGSHEGQQKIGLRYVD